MSPRLFLDPERADADGLVGVGLVKLQTIETCGRCMPAESRHWGLNRVHQAPPPLVTRG